MAKIGFLIEGEFITRHARDLCVDEDWMTAQRFLETVNGLTIQQINAILQGKQKMIGKAGQGKNTLDIAEDDPAETLERLHYIYAGIVRDKKEYWRPYALVQGWDVADVNAMGKHGNWRYDMTGRVIPSPNISGPEAMEEFGKGRTIYYANDPANDRVENVACGAVLFEKVGPPPTWWDIPIQCDWEDAVRLYEEHRTLETRGAGIVLEYEHKEYDFVTSSDQMTLKDMLFQGASGSGLSAAALDGTLDHILGTDEEEPLIPADSPDSDYGYILPDGTFYACKYHGHAELARRIFVEVLKITEDIEDSERAADDAAWLRLSRSAFDNVFKMMICGNPTRQQLNALSHWCEPRELDSRDLEKFPN